MKNDRNLLSARYKEGSGGRFFYKYGISSECIEEFKTALKTGYIRQEEHDACPLCFTKDAILIAEMDRMGIPSKIVICKGCGLVFNDSFFSNDSLEAVYRDFYGAINFGNIPPDENFQKRIKPDAPSWKRFAFIALTLDKELKEISTVFEIGCRDGCNLLPFYLSGKDVLGCDFDERYLNVGRAAGLTLINGDATKLDEFGGECDLIILSHVFEHFIDLDEEIKTVKEILKPGGYVYVEVPGLLNWNRPISNPIKEDWFSSSNNFLSYLQCVHNYHFDLEKVVMFFARNGFEMVYGDEWVRAIFKGSDKMICEGMSTPKSALKTLSYLKNVESNYMSIASFAYRIGRKMMKIINN
jgi:SAM-dependent methyltransferase